VSLHDTDPRVEEVLDENGVLGVVGLEDGGEEGGDLLGLWREGDRLACSKRVRDGYEEKRVTASAKRRKDAPL
jgi:hypothetical protein